MQWHRIHVTIPKWRTWGTVSKYCTQTRLELSRANTKSHSTTAVRCEGNLAVAAIIPWITKSDWAEWLGGCPFPPSALYVSLSQICMLLWREQPFSKQDFRREFVSNCTPLLESANRLSSHHRLLFQKCTVTTSLTPISVEASLNMVQQAPKGPWTRCQATLRTQWPNLKTINYVSLLVSFNNRSGEGAETRQEQPTAYSYLLLTPGFSLTTPSPGC